MGLLLLAGPAAALDAPVPPHPPLGCPVTLPRCPGPAPAGAAARGPCIPVSLVADRCHRWEAAYAGGAGGGQDGATALAVSPDGETAYVTGYTWGSEFDYATVAYEAATGAQRWVARYDGPNRFRDVATAVGVSPDGSRVFVTGWSYGPGSYNYATVAYDAASGDPRWTAVYKGPGNDIDAAYGLAVAPDGSEVYVTGESVGAGTGYDMTTVAYDASTGAQRWVARTTGERNYQDTGRAVAVSDDGSRVFVTGSRGPSTNFDYLTAAYEAADPTRLGTEVWAETYAHAGSRADNARDLAVAGDAVFVTGDSEAQATGPDVATVAYDANTGARRWVARADGNGYPDGGVGIATAGGSVFVTGSSTLVDSLLVFDDDYLTIAYDAATGGERWQRRYDGPAGDSDLAGALAVSGSAVYVTGSSLGPPTRGAFGLGWDAATVAYDTSTGDRRWVARYDTGDQDLAWSMGAAAGRVFVAGTSFHQLTGYDFATEAYDA